MTPLALAKNTQEKKGVGAGIRVHGTQAPRTNLATNDTPWQKVTYDFEVKAGEDEKDLVCELRAATGEARFDRDYLKLLKVAKEEKSQ